MRSGRPRGPGKALRNLGGFAPHLFEGLTGAPGPARLQKCTQKTSGQTAFRYPVWGAGAPKNNAGWPQGEDVAVMDREDT